MLRDGVDAGASTTTGCLWCLWETTTKTVEELKNVQLGILQLAKNYKLRYHLLHVKFYTLVIFLKG